MSNIADMGLDLENLFQPAWAQGKSEANRFEKFTGDEGARPERRRGEPGDRRGPRREAAVANAVAAKAVRRAPAGVANLGTGLAGRAAMTAATTAASVPNRPCRCRN